MPRHDFCKKALARARYVLLWMFANPLEQLQSALRWAGDVQSEIDSVGKLFWNDFFSLATVVFRFPNFVCLGRVIAMLLRFSRL